MEEQSAAEQLTEEFAVTKEALAELQKELPQIETAEQIPLIVRKDAVEQNITLLDAYLRYQHREQQAIAAEIARREKTQACAAGSLRSGGLRASPTSNAFARAFEKALR